MLSKPSRFLIVPKILFALGAQDGRAWPRYPKISGPAGLRLRARCFRVRRQKNCVKRIKGRLDDLCIRPGSAVAMAMAAWRALLVLASMLAAAFATYHRPSEPPGG